MTFINSLLTELIKEESPILEVDVSEFKQPEQYLKQLKEEMDKSGYDISSVDEDRTNGLVYHFHLRRRQDA